MEALDDGEAAVGSPDSMKCSMVLVLFLDRRRATAVENYCIEPVGVHHMRPFVEQKSCCSSSRYHLDRLVARMVFEDTYCSLLGVLVGHSLQGYAGCMCLRVVLLAYDRNSARLWLAWHEDPAMYHACSLSLRTTSQVSALEIQYYRRVPVSVAPSRWFQVADFVIDLQG